MAIPITWQNIHGASLSEASRPLEVAQRSFNAGFDQLGGLLQQRETINAANAVKVRDNNTQMFLDKLTEVAKTPEQLQAAMADGSIDQLRASFGNNIDAAAVRGAPQALLAKRQLEAKQGTEFNNFMLDEKEKPIRDAWKVASLRGDKATQQLLEQQNPNLRNMAELYATQRNIDHENVVWDENKKDYVRRAEKHTSDMKKAEDDLKTNASQRASSAASIRASDQSVEASKSTTRLNNARFNQDVEDRTLAAQAKVRQEIGALADREASSANGSKAIFDEIAKIGDKDVQNNARLAASKMIATPGMTTGAVIASVMGMQDTSWNPLSDKPFFESSARKSATEAAKAILATPESIGQQKSTEIRKAQLFEQTLKLNLKEARRTGDKATVQALEKALKISNIKPDDEDR